MACEPTRSISCGGTLLLDPIEERQRPEDIPLLAVALVRRAATIQGKVIDAITPDALTYLSARRWPGNVRELAWTSEWAVAHATTGTLQLEDLLLASGS